MFMIRSSFIPPGILGKKRGYEHLFWSFFPTIVTQNHTTLFTHSYLELYGNTSIFKDGDYREKYNEIHKQVHKGKFSIFIYFTEGYVFCFNIIIC